MNSTPTVPTTAPLISVPALAQAMMSAPATYPIVVIDCRFNLAAPDAGHLAWQSARIPGARYAHLDHDLSGPKTGHNGRHPLPDPARFAATVQHWGITPNTLVVAYDDAGGMFAARLWWMLHHWLGHAHCAVLDGGWTRWTQEGQAVDTAAVPAMHSTPESAASMPVMPHATSPVIVATQEVLAAQGHPDQMQLIDARAPDRFAGLNETMDPVGGHIPGALNRFFKDNLDANGNFKPEAQLRDEFTQLLGPRDLRTVVHQCGSGVTACHNLLAMDVAGLFGSRLYAGSWSEWCADPARPCAQQHNGKNLAD